MTLNFGICSTRLLRLPFGCDNCWTLIGADMSVFHGPHMSSKESKAVVQYLWKKLLRAGIPAHKCQNHASLSARQFGIWVDSQPYGGVIFKQRLDHLLASCSFNTKYLELWRHPFSVFMLNREKEEQRSWHRLMSGALPTCTSTHAPQLSPV